MGTKCHEGIDTSSATGIGVGNAEYVSGCVACERVAEEDGTAGGGG